jgi:serine/threonine protein kinase
MAETFVGVRTGPNGFTQRSCVKRIRHESARDPGWVKQFRREAHIAEALHHQNIVSLFGFGEEDGVLWLSFELIDGVDLRVLLNAQRDAGTRLPLDLVLFITGELAKALEYAHGRVTDDGLPGAVVHRDLTPSNVLISTTGEVLLADFGIAKAMDDPHTRTGQLPGKIGYMSPEQAAEEPTDERTDLFSLGVMLFEMLAGTRPFDGPTWVMTKINTHQDRRKDLRALAPETPEALVEIVRVLTANRREDRMQSAEALWNALAPLPVDRNAGRRLGALVRAVKSDRDAKDRAALDGKG